MRRASDCVRAGSCGGKREWNCQASCTRACPIDAFCRATRRVRLSRER